MTADHARRQGGDLRRRLSGAARGYVGMTAATVFVSFVVQVALARELGPTGLGEYTATSLFVAFVTTFTFGGAAHAISQRVARFDESGGTELPVVTSVSFGLSLVAAAASAIIGAVAWGAFARLGALPSAAHWLVVAATCGAAVLLQFAGAVLLGHLRFGQVTILSIMQPVFVGAGLLARPGGGLDGSNLAALGFLGAGTIALAGLLVEGVRPSIRRDELALLARRAIPASILPYTSLLTTWLDRAVVIAVAGATGLGWFAAVSYITEGILRIPRGLGAFGVPAYARLADDQVGARRVLDSHVRIVGAILLIAGAALIGAGGGLVTFIFREDFALGKTALRLLAMALVPMGTALTLAGNAVGVERFRRATNVILVIAPLQLVTSAAATYVFSITGTAFAEVLVWTVAVALLAFEPGGRAHAVSLRTMARLTAVSAAVWVIAWALGTSELHWAVSSALAAAVASALVLAFLVGRPEIRVLRQLVVPTSAPERG